MDQYIIKNSNLTSEEKRVCQQIVSLKNGLASKQAIAILAIHGGESSSTASRQSVLTIKQVQETLSRQTGLTIKQVQETLVRFDKYRMSIFPSVLLKSVTMNATVSVSKKQPLSQLTVQCKRCGNLLSNRAFECPKCKTARTDKCNICKAEIPISNSSCPNCGDPTPFQQQSPEKNNSIGIIKPKEESTSSASGYLPDSDNNKKFISRKSFNHSDHGKYNLEFRGTTFEWFWRGLLTLVLSCFIIPAPWMFSWFCNWFVQNIKKTIGNTTLSFSGRGSQIWFPVIAILLLPLVANLFAKVLVEPIWAWLSLVYLINLMISVYFYLLITRWFFKNIHSSQGTTILFMGEYFLYLGWYTLCIISFVSIIGWAWVTAGMVKWICRNIKIGNNHKVEFHGNGCNILWRSVIYMLSCIFIIPIPWTSFWLVKWYISNLSIGKTDIKKQQKSPIQAFERDSKKSV